MGKKVAGFRQSEATGTCRGNANLSAFQRKALTFPPNREQGRFDAE